MIAALLLAAAAAAPPRVDVALDRTEAALGDRVVATYTLRAPKGSRLAIDALVTPARGKDAPQDAGPVLDFQKPGPAAAKADGNVVVLSQKVAFTPLAAGTVPLPGPYFTLLAPDGSKTSFRAPAVAITVDSRLPKNQAKEKLAPRPGRPVRIPAISPWWWVALGAGLLAAAAGVVLWLRRRSRGFEGRAAGAETLAPGPELLATLATLAKKAEELGEDPRGFYSELTHAVKRYLERRLELPVLEWTTFETVRRLREAGLEPPREAALPDLLSAADFVKFGKGAASREAARAHLSRARLLYDHMESAVGGASLPPAGPPHARAAESSRTPVPKERAR